MVFHKDRKCRRHGWPMVSALESRILLAAEPLLVDFGQTGAASTYTNLSSTYVAGTTITTPAHQNGLASTYDVFNNVGTADIASGMVWGDGSAATGVSLAFGRSTTSGGTINYSDSSNLKLISASPATSNDEFNSTLFKGSTANSSQQTGEEAMAITGLSAGTYDVFVINNSISASGELCNDQIGTNITAYKATLAQMQGPLDFDGTFTAPGDFVAATVVVNAGDKLDVVAHGFGNNAGYQKFNLLEVVPTSLVTSSGAQVVPQAAVHRGAAEPSYNNAFNQWIDNTSTWASDAEAYGNWSQIDDATWLYSAWGPWVSAQAGRRLVVSIPMLPSSGGNLAQGAAGNFTSGSTNYFQTLAQNLVSYGLGNSIIRLGWEFNGNWYPWYAGENSGDSGSTGNFVNYWRLIVTDMRATAPNLKFDWNPSMGVNSVASEPEYPGNAYVDYIGVDAYDASWVANTYPWPTGDSAADIESRQEIACNSYMNETEGLLYWSQFAASEGKPLSFPEWGVWDRTDGHGGMDDPYFIDMMKAYMTNPANNVAFESYFDVSASDGSSQLSPGPNGTQPLQFPNSTAAYQTHFSGETLALSTNADIGSPGVAGGAIYSPDDDTWTVTGSGAGIGAASDQFHLASITVTGDQVLTARDTSTSSILSAGQSGLMMRDGNGAAAAYVDLTVSPTNGLVFQYRSLSGVVSSVVASASASTPIWLELLRTGNLFTAYYATSTLPPGPSDWIPVGSISIAFTNSNYQAGLAVTAGNNSLVNTATFDTLALETEPLPSGWTNADIGAPAAAGSATYLLTAYSQAGGGAGIGGTSDQFNYTYQSAAKDEELVARVDGVVSPVSSAGAGLMFRDSTAANAIDVLLDVQPTGAIDFSYRGATGATTTTAATVQGTVPTLAAPTWIKLARSGSTFTAYYATGNVTPTSWTPVGSAITTSMNATSYLAGLAATANSNTGALCSGVFHSVGMACDPVGHKMAVSIMGSTPNYLMIDTANADIMWTDGYDSITGSAQFNVTDAGNGNIALKSVQTGFYLRYDPTDGSLRADQDTSVGSYDIFQWIVADDSGDIALQSMASGTYMINNWGPIMGNQAPALNSQTEFTPTTIVAAPTVTQISPTTGSYSGGNPVIITGTDFIAATAVSFGSTVLPSTSFVINSPTQITAISPAGSVGVVDVTVTTATGKSATSSADKFTYTLQPGWLAASSLATWSSSTETLTVTGNATIDGDPNKFGDAPTIYGNSTSCNLVIDTKVADGGDGDALVHVAAISGNGTTTIIGNNTLAIGNFSQAALVNNGAVTINGAGAIGQLTGSGNLTIGNGSSHNTVQLAAVAIPDTFTNIQASVTVLAGATLDITDNTLLLNYGSGSSPLAAVQATVANGAIMSSSTANAGSSGEFAVGYADATELASIASGNMEMIYTLTGDSLLNKSVNFNDYSVLQNNYNQTGRDWAQGDWNHDSVVNFNDYSLLQNNYLQSVKAIPTLSWATPGAITYGAALSGTQLDATASVAGTFAYTPVLGTVLHAGTQTLAVTFTPTDTTDYYTIGGNVSLTVNKAILTVTANNQSRVYGAANPPLTYGFSGFVNGDTASIISGAPSLSTTATSGSMPNTYPITIAANTLAANDYAFNLLGGNLTVTSIATSIAVTSSNASALYPREVTFTATVTPASGSGATGTVQFQIDGGNVGTPVTLSGNAAAYSIAALAVGNHTVRAIYSGDGNFTGSTSPAITQTIGMATVTYTLSINDDGTGHYCAGHYALYAADSLNNAGLASYDIHLSGAATSTNYSPQGIYDDGTGCGTDDEIGFTALRTANNSSPATASQDTSTYASGGEVILVYGFGQTAGNLADDAAHGSTGGSQVVQAVYGTPLDLLKGTFTASTPTFTSTSLDTGNVFATNSGYSTVAPTLVFGTVTVVSGSVSQPALATNAATTPAAMNREPAPLDQLYRPATANLFAADPAASVDGATQEGMMGYLL